MKRHHHKKAAIIVTLATILAAQNQPFARTPSKPVGIIKQPIEIPSGSVPAGCKAYVNKGPNAAYWLLDCYLSHPSNQVIANNIAWVFNGQVTSWAQWPAWAKNDLVNTFNDTVAWYKSGMTNYPGVLVKDAPEVINLAYLIDHNGAGAAVYDEATTAWPLYIGHVALNLAAEIYAWVPWSLKNFDNQGIVHAHAPLPLLLEAAINTERRDSVRRWTARRQTRRLSSSSSRPTISLARRRRRRSTAPWIGRGVSGTRAAAPWATRPCSSSFDHYGPPPVARVINGTVTTCTSTPTDWQVTPHNWTAGCPGTSGFMATIFRAVNIPVWQVAAGGGHISPWFMSEKLYLSHGDDHLQSGSGIRSARGADSHRPGEVSDVVSGQRSCRGGQRTPGGETTN